MRRWEFAPAMRRRGDRIRIGRIATALGVLVTLAAEDRTQAQNAPRVSWILSELRPSIRPSWRGLRRACASLATSSAETSARTALAKSVRRLGQAANGAKCPQKNLQNFILRFSTGFGPRWLLARTWRKPSPPAGFRGYRSISPKRLWHRQRLF